MGPVTPRIWFQRGGDDQRQDQPEPEGGQQPSLGAAEPHTIGSALIVHFRFKNGIGRLASCRGGCKMDLTPAMRPWVGLEYTTSAR
jgi:hypothetical protein